ncbi:hypothetical protein, partial [Flammeovirga sp. SJP92]
MIYLLKIIILKFFLLNIISNGFGQGITNDVKLNIISESDTLTEHKPLYLYFEIENLSDSTIYLSKKVKLISSVYPNGNNLVETDGGTLSMHITPMNPFASIWSEDGWHVKPTSRIQILKVKPNQSKQLYKLDIGRYFREINQKLDDDSLKFKPHQEYELRFEYYNYTKLK